MISKADFRKKHKLITNSMTDVDLKNKSNIITDLLLSSRILDNSKCIFIYCSYGREVKTERLINELIRLNKTVLIPKCNIDSETMTAVRYDSGCATVTNVYGIKETKADENYTGKIDLAIVPGVAFDIYGNRLGRGKGYYDKFFKKHNVCKVGLCYSENLSDEEIPHNADDIPMNYIISDRGVLKF